MALLFLAGAVPVSAGSMWETLLQQADAMGLPSRFLKEVPASFVVFEFEDLRQFAAEYHPEGHRMVLNRALSLNAAGGTLKPLSRLTAPELGTLYHELFHAYMDYLETRSKEGRGGATGHPLLERAREVQNCRYGQVDITPVVAKKSLKESRYLSEHEAWEALNETWGVFVGWSVWTSAEFRSGPPGRKSDPTRKSSWLAQLKKADGEGILVGYYEPQDPVERAKTPKHYLAPSFRISPQEVIVLLEWIFEKPRDEASQVLAVMTAPLGSGNGADCRHNS